MVLVTLVMLVTPLIGYILWHMGGILLSFIERQKMVCDSGLQITSGKVAMLYPTCNDFNSRALKTLLTQDAERDIYILDDSTQNEQQNKIDEWVHSQAAEIRIVRRPNKKGYKGGNINYWLSLYGDANTYPYIMIVDADEYLPSDFLSQLIMCIESGQFVFAQGCHLGDAEIHSYFQSVLHLQAEIEWLYQVPARNFIGMPPMLGHGVLLQTKPFLEVGGFPDLVSEDLALTIQFAEKGSKGVIAPHVIGHEEFPRNYQHYWKRRKRWIRADTEVVQKMLKNILQNKMGGLARLDLMAREFRLPLASSYWLVLVILATVPSKLNEIFLHPIAWGGMFFFLITALPALWIKRVRLIDRIRYIFTVSFLGATTIHLHPFATIQGIFGFTSFEPTGAQENERVNTASNYYWWDVLSGLPIFLGGIYMDNWALVAIGFSILYSPLLRISNKQQALIFGTLMFWAILTFQIFSDVLNGYFPISHLIPLLGLAITII